jgi:hypothetical protein
MPLCKKNSSECESRRMSSSQRLVSCKTTIKSLQMQSLSTPREKASALRICLSFKHFNPVHFLRKNSRNLGKIENQPLQMRAGETSREFEGTSTRCRESPNKCTPLKITTITPIKALPSNS